MPIVDIKIRNGLERVEVIPSRIARSMTIPKFIPESFDVQNDIDALHNKLQKQTKVLEPKKDLFYEEFYFSNVGQKVQILLDKLPKDTLPLKEVKIKVQEAYDQGFKDGKEITGNTFQGEIEKHQEWVRKIDSVIEKMKDKFFTELEHFENSLIGISTLIAGQIIGKEVSKDSQLVLEQVRKAIKTLDNEIIFKIHLNADDIEIVKQAKGSLVDDHSRIENVELVVDDTVESGMCFLETAAGMVDGRLRKQLEIYEESLKKTLTSVIKAQNSEIKKEDELLEDINNDIF